jgi:hypothetical protein
VGKYVLYKISVIAMIVVPNYTLLIWHAQIYDKILMSCEIASICVRNTECYIMKNKRPAYIFCGLKFRNAMNCHKAI